MDTPFIAHLSPFYFFYYPRPSPSPKSPPPNPLVCIQNRGKNEHGRVTSPEILSFHLNCSDFFSPATEIISEEIAVALVNTYTAEYNDVC